MEKKKVEEEGLGESDGLEANREIDILAKNKLSLLLLFLSFSSFLVRFSNMFNLLVSIMCE